MSTTVSTNGAQALDVRQVRADFPILQRMVHGVPLIYLDSAATSQKPEAVIRVMDEYYRQHNANVHRGIHVLSEEATEAYEGARKRVAKFINAASWREVIFVRNTTEALNLVVYAWGRANIKQGDVILITGMEHHSNIVPWQLLAAEKNARLDYIEVASDGTLRLEQLDAKLTEQVKVFAFTAMSNVLGTINPTAELVRRAHAVGAVAVVDAAQSVPHMSVDVQALDCDFMAFSGHKMCGPTGSGVLYGKKALLEAMPPFMGGGDMIKSVTLTQSKWNDLPWKFEAGTPSIAEGIGLGAAVDYLTSIGMDRVRAHEKELVGYGIDRLAEVDDLTLYGPADPDIRGGVLTFNLKDIHAHDLSTLLDQDGIAIRAGHHCAQPLMEHLCVAATARASLYLYNDAREIDQLVVSLRKAAKVFAL
ncbi:MAG: cysteine desulfurase [Chloroflexi bacterium]|nr:MAG: cysteine desulfurase [Chloroflexota bacterium]